MRSCPGLHERFSKQPAEPGYNANENIELWIAGDPGFDPANPFRNRQAAYFLPSVHEWYKAAYYDPTANGGVGGYWNFPTGSNSPPTPVASGTAAGTAVYNHPASQGPADTTLAGGLSPYGTMAQGGNVWEWEETEDNLVNDDGPAMRGMCGGDWNDDLFNLSAAGERSASFPSQEHWVIGFRVARIPEPSSIWAAALGVIGLMMRRGR
jgi:formylglycine-generating enzyme required for sulfatase activity